VHEDEAKALTLDVIAECKKLAQSPKLEPVLMSDGKKYYYVGLPGFNQPSRAEALHMWENVKFLDKYDPA
jgi:hypothetical protein